MTPNCIVAGTVFGPMIIAFGLFLLYAGIEGWRNPNSIFVVLMQLNSFRPRADASPFERALRLTREDRAEQNVWTLRTFVPLFGLFIIAIGTYGFFSDLHIPCKV